MSTPGPWDFDQWQLKLGVLGFGLSLVNLILNILGLKDLIPVILKRKDEKRKEAKAELEKEQLKQEKESEAAAKRKWHNDERRLTKRRDEVRFFGRSIAELRELIRNLNTSEKAEQIDSSAEDIDPSIIDAARTHEKSLVNDTLKKNRRSAKRDTT